MKNQFKMRRLLPTILGIIVLVPFLAQPPARADDEREGNDREHLEEQHHRTTIRGAVERGEIQPLESILTVVRAAFPGEIVGVEVERKSGGWVYEVRVADKNGRLVEAYVDAQSGQIIRSEEK